MESFIQYNHENDFSIYNIPFGVYKKKNDSCICCTRIGDYVLDLDQCQKIGIFHDIKLPVGIFNQDKLNNFIGLGKQTTIPVRETIQRALLVGGSLEKYKNNKNIFVDALNVEMVLPIAIGDYTDFYSSREHATNVGKMFRDPENALLPNWLHLPVGYHGRSSSIVVSGTNITRPKGQTLPPNQNSPIFGPTKQLDFELEMGFIVGKSTQLGETISVKNAEEHIFGLCLFNDWSARDIQKWEYVPLGPFLAKNFASTMSPWIVTLEALELFRTEGPKQEVEVLEYLKYEGDKNFDINLSVDIISEFGYVKRICNSNFKYMYWNMCQQLAHHTVNGCNVNIGDMLASGTISGSNEDSFGSMLELSWKGTKPIEMPDGSTRTFIHDGDSIVMRGACSKGDIRIGFGPCDGKILPSNGLMV